MALRFARRKPQSEAPPPAAKPSAIPQVAPGAPSTVGHAIVRLLPRENGEPAASTAEPHSACRLPDAAAVRRVMIDADLILSGAAAWCRGLALLLSHIGLEFDASSSERLWRNRHLADAFRGRRELGDAVDDYLCSLGLARADRDEVLAASLAQWREGESQLHFLPGARDALRRIARAGGCVALVADVTVSGPELAERLTIAGLANVITTIVTSVDVDRVLPHGDFYEELVSRVGPPAGASLFVAQDRAILEGATSAGLSSVACGQPPYAESWHVTRLDQLASLFQSAAPWAKAG